MVEFVVAELGVDGGLDLVRRGLGDAHDGAHIFVDGVVDPRQDALTHHMLVGIATLLGCWQRGDVVKVHLAL